MCNIVTIYTIFLVFHAYFTPVMLISSCSFSLERDVAEDRVWEDTSGACQHCVVLMQT